MEKHDYQTKLLLILREHTEQAVRTLHAMDAKLPKTTKAIHIVINANQEPDGMFSVMIHLDGPDLASLNRAIDGHRLLFDVRYEGENFEPPVPMFDAFDDSLPVNDIILDTAVIWIQEAWSDFGGTAKTLPATIFGDDGYGKTVSIQLTS